LHVFTTRYGNEIGFVHRMIELAQTVWTSL
jgi:hypothetical protein